MTPSALTCSRCGEHPTELEAKYTARLGGTHYKRVSHGVGIPGNKGNRTARTCGTWVAAEERARSLKARGG